MILGELFIPSRDCKMQHETREDEEDSYSIYQCLLRTLQSMCNTPTWYL